MQALLTVHQYYVNKDSSRQTPTEKALTERELSLATRIDQLWREVDWNFYRQNGQNVL